MYSNRLVIEALRELENEDLDSTNFTSCILGLYDSYNKLYECITYVSHGVFTVKRREEDCTPLVEMFQRPDYPDGVIGRITTIQKMEDGITFKSIDEMVGTFEKGEEIFKILFTKLMLSDSKSPRDFD